MKFFLLFLFGVLSVDGAKEGDICTVSGVNGVCKTIQNCPSSDDDARRGIVPAKCDSESNDAEFVCCKIDQREVQKIVEVKMRSGEPSTTAKIPDYDYEFDDYCDAIQSYESSTPTYQKAWNKCREYQDRYVFPCIKDGHGSAQRDHRCPHYEDDLLPGVIRAYNREFAHRVRLGYTSELNSTDSHCEGALISEMFILTAATCIRDRLGNNVSYALVGPKAGSRYGILRAIPHPEYRPTSDKHNLALLKLDRDIPLNGTYGERALPACLHVGNKFEGPFIYVTNTTDAYKLRRAELKNVTKDMCDFDENTQFCYEEGTQLTGSFQGITGSPLQVKTPEISCTFTILGVTSQGGLYGGGPALFARVAHYLPWLESVVWP